MGADAALTTESPPHEPSCQFRARPLMDYLLSDHARKRIQKRKIWVEWVEATLTDPVRTESDAVDPTLVHALRPIPERGFRVLRVIYNETRHPPVVVTAYFDSEVNDR